MKLLQLPTEIIHLVLSELPIKDLVRTERTCKQLQWACLHEINRRMAASHSDYSLLVHLKQTAAQWQQFDPKTKTAHYKVDMDPVTIRSMYDQRRLIECTLLRKKRLLPISSDDPICIPVQKGIDSGETVHVSIRNGACQLEANVTHLTPAPVPLDRKMRLAPRCLSYSIQITSMSLPLSTIAV
ncbi:hypothetical protein DM01DRAFT_1334956 [Hesseltinella vesiculosa]|uniref:F-box domain-containing protein n=1 Tax=Hesseltinella vesiculosa TaxID=101127 RepID=A0A1X2GJV7_9FUNG|nr:hypothetical protein DM01DRAFT_1334956 [Hesseltinella vesiculosa]